MADVLEEGPLTDAAAALALGKRHLLVRDYNSAVNTLIQACELLVQKHGDGADELAEPYLLYGRALLNLAREESNVLGSAVPCDEKDSDEEADVDGEDEEEGDGDEEMDETDEKKETELKKGGEVADKSATKEGKKVEEKKPTESNKDEKSGENEVSKAEGATPGSSKMVNGGSSSHMNGDIKENGEDDEEVNDDEDADNLEVAWEVLELAKLVLLKRGPPGWHLLSEAHKLLGEVAMEGGNVSGALTDFHACLDLLQKIEPCNPRAIAEIYYQLGLAYSFANDFDSSIEQFKEAGALLEARIKELEETRTSEPAKSSDDPFYTVEGEIKELRELLPEIEEKISDMKDAKQEACRLIIEGIREKASAGGCSNGASTSNGPSSSGASLGPFGSASSSSFGTSAGSSTSKPVTDISHLIRKKRKPEENQADEASSSPCKKMSPQ
ncbi:protein HGV2 [Belonocnema kinseyi]|uniref:protein HGV2 n=1 Tax=Belonocnema kinseyi TaxID=2817044 RepID=UPI00143DC54D|nr:protein HGV2 [Belonocnema kinseyi]XP_033213599.1 protein HGV2 [Belonocnema kinseyi]XP_033213600.1 protein HGV2 [Belonocnema kinseyi]XP_033213601.1 protein HGV2 [Belonocnema kinseyi]